MSKPNPLTESQKSFIDLNKNKMGSRQMAEVLGTTQPRVMNYMAKVKKRKLKQPNSQLFNVYEMDNWIINNQ